MPQTPNHWRRRKPTLRQKALYNTAQALMASGRTAANILVPKTRLGRKLSWTGIPSAAIATAAAISYPARQFQIDTRSQSKRNELTNKAKAESQTVTAKLRAEIDKLESSKWANAALPHPVDEKVKQLGSIMDAKANSLGYALEDPKILVQPDSVQFFYKRLTRIGSGAEVTDPHELQKLSSELNKTLTEADELLGVSMAQKAKAETTSQFNAGKDVEISRLTSIVAQKTHESQEKAQREYVEYVSHQPSVGGAVVRDSLMAGGAAGLLIGGTAAIVAAKKAISRLRHRRQQRLENERLRQSHLHSLEMQARNNELARRQLEGLQSHPEFALPEKGRIQTPVPSVPGLRRENVVRRMAENEGLGGDDLNAFTRFFRKHNFGSQGQVRHAVSVYMETFNRVSSEFKGLNIPEELLKRHALETAAGNTEGAANTMEQIRKVVEARQQSGRSVRLPINPRNPANEKLFSRLRQSNPKLHEQLLTPHSDVNDLLVSVLDSLRHSYPERFIAENRGEISAGVVKLLLGMVDLYKAGNVHHETAVNRAGVSQTIRGPMLNSIGILKSAGVIRVYGARDKAEHETIQLNWPDNPITRLFVPTKGRNNNH
jgi:hypothetical protein